MEKIEEELKDRLKRLRAEAGLTQVALANLADISLQTVKDIEGGRKGAGIRVLQGFAKAFNMPIEELTSEIPPKAEPVIKFRVRKLTRMLEAIPDEVYELAQDLEGDEAAWENIKMAINSEIASYKKRKVATKQEKKSV